MIMGKKIGIVRKFDFFKLVFHKINIEYLKKDLPHHLKTKTLFQILILGRRSLGKRNQKRGSQKYSPGKCN
jgi:hypothetical protein